MWVRFTRAERCVCPFSAVGVDRRAVPRQPCAAHRHAGLDLEEQRRLRAVIEGNVGRKVDVSTSFGLGRRARPAAVAALELAAD